MVMPRTHTAHGTDAHQRRARYARWARLIDTILPPPDENRLVSVAEVSRTAIPFVEESLADVGLTAVVNPVRTMTGEERYQVLVPASDAAVAQEVVAGC